MAGKAPAGKPAASQPAQPAKPAKPAKPAPSSKDTFTEQYRKSGGSTPPTREGTVRSAGSAAASVDNAAGFLLALLFWSWIALPFLKGGAGEVKKVLRAKFLNKAPDGSWLP